MRRNMFGRVASALVLLSVVVGAVAWVSVPFTDRSFSCGTSLGEWQHGFKRPVLIPLPQPGQPEAEGAPLVSTGRSVTLCQGQAEGRLAESVAAIGVAAVAVALAVDRRRTSRRPANRRVETTDTAASWTGPRRLA